MTRLFCLLLLGLALPASAQTEAPIDTVDPVDITDDDLTFEADVFEADDHAAEIERMVLTAARVAQIIDATSRIGRAMQGEPFGEIVDVRSQTSVQFEVSGVTDGDPSALLVDLSDADALRALSATSTASGATSVEASFRFGSVAEWAAWRALPETEALLGRLSGGPLGLRTTLTATRLMR